MQEHKNLTCIDADEKELAALAALPVECEAAQKAAATGTPADRLADIMAALPDNYNKVILAAIEAKASIHSLADAFEQLIKEGSEARLEHFVTDLQRQVNKRTGRQNSNYTPPKKKRKR